MYLEVQSDKFPGYYKVPGFPSIVVSESGSVIDSENGQHLDIRNSEYRCVRGLVDGVRDPKIHDIVTRAFYGPPPMEEVFEANHRDGIKHNNHKDNLEWLTRRENCLHALENGLRPDAKPVLVRDLRDESVRRFYGQNECARHFGVNSNVIAYQLKKPRIFNRNYVIIQEGTQWPDIEQLKKNAFDSGVYKRLLAQCVKTGKVYVFDGVAAASEYLGLSRSSLAGALAMRKLGKVNKNKPYQGYLFSDKTIESNEDVIFANRKTFARKTQTPIPILVTDLNDGVQSCWYSTEDFARHHGAKRNTIHARLYRTGGRWKHFKIEYLPRLKSSPTVQ